jgi:putative membrane protein
MLPYLFILFCAILGLYLIAMGRIALQLPPAQQKWHLVWFTLGLVITMFIFIPSPDLFGPDHRFTVNMAQMLLAIDVAPPLLELGIPFLMVQPLLRWEKLGRRLSAPIISGSIGLLLLMIWFLPGLFSAASSSLPLWLFKQWTFLLAGLLMWWPITGPLVDWRPSYPVQMLYLFIIRLPMALLGIMLSLADQLIYSPSSFALEICAPASVSDQQAGGLMMWLVGGWILFIAFTIVFFRWFGTHNVTETGGI